MSHAKARPIPPPNAGPFMLAMVTCRALSMTSNSFVRRSNWALLLALPSSRATGELSFDRSIPVQKNFPLAVIMMRDRFLSVWALMKTSVSLVIMDVVRALPFLGRLRTIFSDFPER